MFDNDLLGIDQSSNKRAGPLSYEKHLFDDQINLVLIARLSIYHICLSAINESYYSTSPPFAAYAAAEGRKESLSQSSISNPFSQVGKNDFVLDKNLVGWISIYIKYTIETMIYSR